MARLPLMTTSSTDAADRQNVDHSDHQDLQRRGDGVYRICRAGPWEMGTTLGAGLADGLSRVDFDGLSCQLEDYGDVEEALGTSVHGGPL